MTSVVASAALLFTWSGALGDGPGSLPLQTTLDDFFDGGTQPTGPTSLLDQILPIGDCAFCHGDYDVEVEPLRPWQASMMGQSSRDPMFWACLAVANQDAVGMGEFCFRCHIPNAFLGDRTFPPDGSALVPQDFEGINCSFCHRLVNPVFPVPGDGPLPDGDILAVLDAENVLPPDGQGGNARYVVDPIDSRRGPFDDLPSNPHPAETYFSPFHTQAEFCWTCHDVSNMNFVKQPDGTYALDTLGTPHPTGLQEDMFPLHRTYGEWKNSYYFTLGGVQHNGRFGGNHINNPDFIADGTAGIMHTCQDCHMPDQAGKGCIFFQFPDREDVPQHSFNGSNTWGLKAIRAVDADGDSMPDFPDVETGLTDATVDAAVARALAMLEAASDLELTQIGPILRARIVNQTGHKLPTGFPDGRRMWLNVKFLDAEGGTVFEHGEFDFSLGTIVNPQDTTVYEIKLGIDAEQAKVTGLPEGPTFHFVLANTVAKDNRIPPRGFSNSVAEQNQTVPVGATYIDGQHWDDTDFPVPDCAVQAVATTYYQLVSREYITFLRDTNMTNNRGQVAFDLWDDPLIGNRSAPVVMDMETIDLTAVGPTPDLDDDGVVGILDFLILLGAWGPCDGACPADLDCDGVVGILDFLLLLDGWG